jgi:hypothetical protein
MTGRFIGDGRRQSGCCLLSHKNFKMRNLYFLFILLLCIGSLSCKKEDSNVLIEPRGWFLSGNRIQNYQIGIDDLDAQHGQKSGYIASVVDTSTGFGTLMQLCNGNNFRGERIRMRGYIQSYGLETTLTMMWVRVDDFDKRVIADFDDMDNRPITGTQFWRSCEIVFDVPESNCVINYGVVLIGTGKVWMDNVTFDTVSRSTIKTADYLDIPLPSDYSLPQDLPDEPINLDFEE